MRRRLVFLGVILVSAPSLAAVEQTDGMVIPVLPTQVERSLVSETYGWNALTNSWKGLDGEPLVTPIVFGQYYSPPEFPQFVTDDAITLAGLFKWRGEAIDWLKDATAPSGAFTPHCPITVEPVLRGGTCDAALAWYNVLDPASTAPPAKAELYELLPADLAQFLDCREASGAVKTDGFCPLAWDTRLPRDLSRHGWVPDAVTLDLSTDHRYRGGAIGFALVPAVTTSYCKDPHYSVLQHNVRNAANEPYVTSIVYTSRKEPGAFYLAFDDGVMLPSDWTNAGKTDGDYNDYVAYVSGCFDDNGGGSGAGGAAGAGGAGASSAAGEANRAGDGPTSDGGNAGSGGTSAHTEGGDAGPDRGSSGDDTGGSSPGSGASAGAGDGSSTSSGSCGCRFASQNTAGPALLGLALGAGWLARRVARRRALAE
jgi:hypothetical protein